MVQSIAKSSSFCVGCNNVTNDRQTDRQTNDRRTDGQLMP